MKALFFATLAALAVTLTVGVASSEPCARGFGIVYDELHSFQVEAPGGWCCAQAKGANNCRPAEFSVEPSPVIGVSFRYLATPNADLASLARGELASLSPGASPVEQSAVRTQNGRLVRVWQVSSPGSPQRLVGLLVHELVLVRFVLEQPQSAARGSSAIEAFRHLVSSFRSNAPAA